MEEKTKKTTATAGVGNAVKIYFKENLGIIVAFLVLCVFLSVFPKTSGSFFTRQNIFNVLRQISTNLFLACGMTMVIILGGIDLSVGSIIALSGCISAGCVARYNLPLPIALLMGLLVGLLVGMFNGAVISKTTIPAFIVTLATMNIAKGLAYVYTGGSPVRVVTKEWQFLGAGYVGIFPARGVNNNAVDFIREMNRGLKTLHPTAMLSAEDSTSFEGVTKPADQGGLGFDYKWDMGWMNDTLDYFRTAPEYRSRDYHKLTFSMMYYYNDVFLLPLSHDEVVHGKATIAQKMHGEYEEKFPQARAFYMYMYAHPGKKLNFMGNEIGQLREWDEKREQDWDILKYPIHDAFHHFMQKLNHLYMTTPALSAKDYENAGFHWLDCHQEERCIYAFERTDGKERIAAVFNFSDEDQEGYELPITDAKELEVILASDDVTFGGSKKYTKKKVKVTDGKAVLDLSAYSAVYYSIAV